MASATKSYAVVRRVRHDNEVYKPGDTISLTDAQAQPLLATGAIGVASKSGKKDGDA